MLVDQCVSREIQDHAHLGIQPVNAMYTVLTGCHLVTMLNGLCPKEDGDRTFVRIFDRRQGKGRSCMFPGHTAAAGITAGDADISGHGCQCSDGLCSLFTIACTLNAVT